MARKTKLTRELIEQMRKLASLGVDNKTIAQSLMIGESTFYSWLQRGEQDLKEGKRTLFVEFLEDLKKAHADAIVRNVLLIQESARNGNWQASAWFLERRLPEVWGKKERVDVESSGFELRIKLIDGTRDEKSDDEV